MNTPPGGLDERGCAADLRSAALAFAAHGWPILPGTYRTPAHGTWRGRRGARGLEPITDDLGVASTDPVRVAAWWSCEPYSVLLAGGRGVDALELTAEAGARAVEPLGRAGLRGPTAITDGGAVLLFVRSGTPAEPTTELPVRQHAAGSWLPLPPSAGCRWRVAPEQVGWRLPDPIAVLGALTVALG